MKLHVAFFVLCCGLLQAQVGAPNVGSARFAGRVFAVHGIPANLLVAKAPWTSAEAMSFSDAGGLLSQNGTVSLVSPDGTELADYAAAETAPVLNIDGPLTSAVAWLPSKHALLYWNGTALVPREVNGSFAGEVTSLRLASPGKVLLLVSHLDATHADAAVSAATVSLDTGEITSMDLLPDARGRAFVQRSFFLSQDKLGLVIESAGGAPRTVALVQDRLPEGDLTIERMSTDWLHIFSASTGKHWALYLTSNALRLSALPVPPALEVGQ
jgi:hypothetical protein